MIEALKRWLRGDYNSIRYRYFHLPKAWLVYTLGYRIRGKGWIDFYSKRMDGKADAPFNPKQKYLDFGQFQLDYLKNVGLKPEHQFLDYGCGVMRTGIHLAGYLEPNRYTGVDISTNRLANGVKLMAQHGFKKSSYEAIQVSDCYLKELEGRKFDFVFAASVFTHLPLAEILIALGTIRDLLTPDGVFYFTYAEADTQRRKNIKDFWYRREQLEQACLDAGLEFSVMDDYSILDDVMVRAQRPKAKGA